MLIVADKKKKKKKKKNILVMYAYIKHNFSFCVVLGRVTSWEVLVLLISVGFHPTCLGIKDLKKKKNTCGDPDLDYAGCL